MVLLDGDDFACGIVVVLSGRVGGLSIGGRGRGARIEDGGWRMEKDEDRAAEAALPAGCSIRVFPSLEAPRFGPIMV